MKNKKSLIILIVMGCPVIYGSFLWYRGKYLNPFYQTVMTHISYPLEVREFKSKSNFRETPDYYYLIELSSDNYRVLLDRFEEEVLFQIDQNEILSNYTDYFGADTLQIIEEDYLASFYFRVELSHSRDVARIYYFFLGDNKIMVLGNIQRKR